MGITEDALNERRCEMLDITAQQIKEFGAKLEEGSKKSVLVTVGNENSVKNNDIFQEFLHIH
jgi:hypothetical protein